ncbi:MAG: exo-alpha-sialidase [Clostridia bacterium]|nr:exo-alpha-sialidase [Clostridia bacterium]
MKKINDGIVGRNHTSLFPYQGWPTVTKDENGVLYAVSSGHRVTHICPFGKTLMYKSYDNGKSWSTPIIINDTIFDDRDAGIVYMGSGKMLVTFFKHPALNYKNIPWMVSHIKNSIEPRFHDMIFSTLELYETFPKEELKGGSFVILSNDYGQTWSEPISLPVSAPHGPTFTKDGTLLYLGSEWFTDGKLPAKSIWLYKSSDYGKTWEQVSQIPKPDWLKDTEYFCEPHILELDDGSLLGAIRVESTFEIATVKSYDGGKTWQELKRAGIKGAPPHLYKLSTGEILCSYANRKGPYEEKVAISYDNGETWAKDFVLYESNKDDIGYPSTVELNSGELLTIYYDRYKEDKFTSVLYTKWKLK